MKKAILSGNEAIARGFWEGGGHFANAYPGTPSTEIVENIMKYPEIRAQWAVNEKTSLEIALGASFAGARSLVAMKHVGLNVAADPFFSASYIGSTGGLVIVTADDPGMHSSQNEQDNRWYALHAKVPLFEPTDSHEAKELTRQALSLSEEFDTPWLIRSTTRISHSLSIVELGEREEVEIKGYVPDFEKRNLLPVNARKRHEVVEERTIKLREFSEKFWGNRIEEGEDSIGVVANGISYQHAREAIPDATFLKLLMTWPLPDNLIREFASKVKKIFVVEEGDPYLETYLKAMNLGVEIIGKEKIPMTGELNPTIVREALLGQRPSYFEIPRIPHRPPALCPGCPHTPVFYILKRLKANVTGDIGCYTLGALPPLSSMDTCVEMGGSIGNAYGIEIAEAMRGLDPRKKKLVAVIGDSTFYHSGVTPLIDLFHNNGITTVIILDNSITAMTGHQENPGTDVGYRGIPKRRVDIEKLVRGIGVEHVYTVDSFDMKKLKEVINREIHRQEPSVIIAKRPCVLLPQMKKRKYTYAIADPEKCTSCTLCWKLGCPAISVTKDKKTWINPDLCVGCGVCIDVCPVDAIYLADPEADNARKAGEEVLGWVKKQQQ